MSNFHCLVEHGEEMTGESEGECKSESMPTLLL